MSALSGADPKQRCGHYLCCDSCSTAMCLQEGTATESRPGRAPSSVPLCAAHADLKTPLPSLPPLPPPGSTLTLIPLRRSGLLSLSTWFTTPVGRPGKVSLGQSASVLHLRLGWFIFIRLVFCVALSWKSCVGSPCLYGRTTAVCPTTTGSTQWRWHTVCTPSCRKPLGYSQSSRFAACLVWVSLLLNGSEFNEKQDWLVRCFVTLRFTEEGSVDSLLVPRPGSSRIQQHLPAEVRSSAGCSVLHLHHGAAPLLSDCLNPTGRAPLSRTQSCNLRFQQ